VEHWLINNKHKIYILFFAIVRNGDKKMANKTITTPIPNRGMGVDDWEYG